MLAEVNNAARSSHWQRFLVDQSWTTFTPDDHAVWDELFARQMQLLRGRVVSPFFEGVDELGLRDPGVPNLSRLNERLVERTGWRCVSVAGLVPDEAFFAMLAARLFPIGNFIRSRTQMDYLKEPDCFHDIFGHVPMLADPRMASAMRSVGEFGLEAIASGEGQVVARLYWHTVEFGLCKEDGELRILGAGLASSFGEARASLEDPSIDRRRFTFEAATASPYRHDAMQPLYFVSDNFEAAIAALHRR
ncbi:phenylalanine 4-monooxygenase [Sphingomonas sp. LY29]|uniref:phenylalanine 4-monooxygenase n=1 Tax=Sphingomonas sp. LY29 TaxID=3095341 RepID=UPI002D7858C9|nr:phenylalanine 4-monooxygenase [Sphingomonas sp. LY29]WRP26369.1 phenylalanine 4-monooxygenase [Sphingomonas sp. LY29]